jgi:hypothetical protein
MIWIVADAVLIAKFCGYFIQGILDLIATVLRASGNQPGLPALASANELSTFISTVSSLPFPG